MDAGEKKDVLARILGSETFAHSQSYRELLTYLVEASIRNVTPKEYAIATEVLHKDPQFDSGQNTIVRVCMYNLRRKLEQYYANEGREDAVRIELPKGHYSVTFVGGRRKRRAAIPGRAAWMAAAALLALANALAWFFWVRPGEPADGTWNPRAHPVWAGLFGNGVPDQIVLGDHFFFVREPESMERRMILRRDDVNSAQDFKRYKAGDPDRRGYRALEYPVFPRNSVWPFADLAALFESARAPFRLNYASSVTASDVKDFDLVFVGSFHTLANLDQVFRNSRFAYGVYPNALTARADSSGSPRVYREEGDPAYSHVDYGVVMKLPGPNRNLVLVFTGFHETGTTGIVKTFSQPDSLDRIERRFVSEFGRVPEYFELLYRASGYNRIAYRIEILAVHEIRPENVRW